jgi:hypothetical protein
MTKLLKTAKAANYTPEMVSIIAGYSHFDAAVAAEIAGLIGKSPRSVIAKIKSLDLPYTIKRPARKDGSDIARKSDTVNAIAKALAMDVADLDGLAKAPRSALEALLREIP